MTPDNTQPTDAAEALETMRDTVLLAAQYIMPDGMKHTDALLKQIAALQSQAVKGDEYYSAECIHGIHPDQCVTCTPTLSQAVRVEKIEGLDEALQRVIALRGGNDAPYEGTLLECSELMEKDAATVLQAARQYAALEKGK